MRTDVQESIRVDQANSVDNALDRQLIQELIQNWVIWRDAGEWDRFATVWHDDGKMIATWFKASAAEFIEGCRKAFDAGIVGLHTLGGTSTDIRGARAVAQTRMQIVQRGTIDGLEVDVTCIGRFVDALEKRNGTWGMVLRQPVYEWDRMSPVEPGVRLELDEEILRMFPDGYRHLAYLQTKAGFTVGTDLPGTRGPESVALSARMKQWLDGDDARCLDGVHGVDGVDA